YAKLHACKLNSIEQCWGYAKKIYQFCPESSREDDLCRNTLESLDQVSLLSIRHFLLVPCSLWMCMHADSMDVKLLGLHGNIKVIVYFP
ncbi:hypothetical protein BT96DRAFT_1083382, partial [Gymnopus androsaceus JB14]